MWLERGGTKGTWCTRYGSLGGRRWAGGLGTGRHNGRLPPRGGQIIFTTHAPPLTILTCRSGCRGAVVVSNTTTTTTTRPDAPPFVLQQQQQQLLLHQTYYVLGDERVRLVSEETQYPQGL